MPNKDRSYHEPPEKPGGDRVADISHRSMLKGRDNLPPNGGAVAYVDSTDERVLIATEPQSRDSGVISND